MNLKCLIKLEVELTYKYKMVKIMSKKDKRKKSLTVGYIGNLMKITRVKIKHYKL